ncbi:hypothetical protein L484_027883 [Morus notabilis]|uniref:Uncharacterized protein n=1 Tax=Morus notabilis TaxID=981085 RepID=W9SFE5_9ROSA|nr:hypothetical protein L484_027883 [Morus notabilis]
MEEANSPVEEETQSEHAKAQLTKGPKRNRKAPAWLEDYVACYLTSSVEIIEARVISNPIVTLQLCVGRRCLIFQLLYAHSIPSSLHEFLRNNNYRFVGVRIIDDVKKLDTDYALLVTRALDLGALAAIE